MTTNELIDGHPLLNKIATGSRWIGKDQFPSNQLSRARVVQWLEYVCSENQFDRFLPRLKDSLDKRDECLAEIKAAYFTEKYLGYPITVWEPPGNEGTLGEFSFTLDGQEVFCEVKSPGWEREVVESEGIDSLRLK